MKKKQLLELPVMGLTEAMLNQALKEERVKGYGWPEEVAFKVAYYFRAAIEQKILKVEIYFTGQLQKGLRKPAYRLFFDNEKNDFTTFCTKNQKWTQARIDNLAGVRCRWDEKMKMESDEKKSLMDYLGITSLSEMEYWQWKVRDTQRREPFTRRAERWEALFRKIRPLPKDWETWLRKHVIQEHYMFYEYRKKGPMIGRCTRCGKEQVLERPRYNQKGVCKKCGCAVTFKSTGKCGRLLSKEYTAHLPQRIEGGIVFRQFTVHSSCGGGQTDAMRIHFAEERRALYDRSGNGRAFYFGEYKDGKMHWIETEYGDTASLIYRYNPCYYVAKGVIYRRTLSDLSKRELKKTGFMELARSGKIFSPEQYLMREKEHPIIEKLAKAGLTEFACDMVESRGWVDFPHDGELHKCLGISRSQLKRLRRENGGYHYLEWMNFERVYGKTLEDEVIRWFLREEIETQDITFIEDRMSPRQIMNYLSRQKEKMPEESHASILRIWKDYLSMAEKNGADIKDAIIYRTPELQKRHDEMVRRMAMEKINVRAQKILLKYPNVNEVLDSLRGKYDYQDGAYAVVVPKNLAELLYEGDTLQHCINNTEHYYERISKKECFLLFLRRADALEIPYYTLEVEPGGTIRQKRTKYNRQNKDIEEASTFLKKWQKVIRKRMSKEDMALAKKSRQLRKEEYRKLRKDQVRVGQGTYGGQLLVDLLEVDLMEIQEAA